MSTPELADVPEQWPVAGSEYAYEGDWVIKLRDDRVRRPGHPDEEAFSRLVLEHPGAAVILAVDEHERAFCLWQYRHAVGGTLVQLPAGLCDVDGEDPAEVARRELAEEAGLAATDWTHLVSAYSSPGISGEVGHYFLARGLTEVGRGDFEPEHEEAEMESGWVPLAGLRDAVLGGRVRDAHLAIALFTAQARGLVGGG
jgi:8-oxo-dGTP pyrophosphatase MutT (NUDIX family)